MFCVLYSLCDLYFVHRQEADLTSLTDLSHIRLIQLEDRLMVIEMLPPNQTVSSVQGQDMSDIHPSLSTTLSELSQPLRVTITFSSADKASVATVQVCGFVLLLLRSDICLQYCEAHDCM